MAQSRTALASLTNNNFSRLHRRAQGLLHGFMLLPLLPSRDIAAPYAIYSRSTPNTVPDLLISHLLYA